MGKQDKTSDTRWTSYLYLDINKKSITEEVLRDNSKPISEE